MEIGILKGHSIRAFRDFFNGVGNFHGMNKNWGGPVIEKDDLQAHGIICHSGDQGDVEFLKSITTQFDIIVEGAKRFYGIN